VCVPTWRIFRGTFTFCCVACRSSRSACSFGEDDFGIDKWPTLSKTKLGDEKRSASYARKDTSTIGDQERPSETVSGVGGSVFVLPKAPAKVSGKGGSIMIPSLPKLRLRPSTSASALLQTAPAVSDIQESVGAVSTRKSGPGRSNVPSPIIPTFAPSDPSVRLYQPPQTNVSPAQVTGRGQWVFVEDIGRFEKAISNTSLNASEIQQLRTELEMIRDRELSELRACQRLVDGREEMFGVLLKRLSKKAKEAMQKLLDEGSEEEGDTTIRVLGEDEGEEEGAGEVANAEAGGSGTRAEEMAED